MNSDSANSRTEVTMNNSKLTADIDAYKRTEAVNNCVARTTSKNNILDDSVTKKIVSVIPRER